MHLREGKNHTKSNSKLARSRKIIHVLCSDGLMVILEFVKCLLSAQVGNFTQWHIKSFSICFQFFSAATRDRGSKFYFRTFK